MQSEVFHVSRSSDGQREWYSARDAATGVSIPCECKDRAIALVTSINSAFKHHLTAALSEQDRAVDAGALEWDKRTADGTTHIASALTGEYWAWELDGYGYWSQGSLPGREVPGGLDAAKAAAQHDYAARRRSALVEVPVEPDYWTSHNNVENMLGKGVTDEKGGLVWDFATQQWVNADVPLYTRPPHREGEDSAEVERLTRPIVGIEYRTAQEVFDIMADRIRLAATRSGSADGGDHG